MTLINVIFNKVAYPHINIFKNARKGNMHQTTE